MLNHHSLNLLINFSELALRGGEFRVNISRNAIMNKNLTGRNATANASKTRTNITLSVACTEELNS